MEHLLQHPAGLVAAIVIGLGALGGLAYCAREAWRHWHHTNALPPAVGRSHAPTQAQRLRDKWERERAPLHPTNAA